MTVIAGIDVGHATTEVVLMSAGRSSARDGCRPAAGRGPRTRCAAPPRWSAGSNAGAGCPAAEARIAPLRAADTSVVTVPDVAPPRGRLRVLAAGVAAPGGTGACVGPPLLLAAADLPAGSPVPAADPPAGSPSHWVPG